jgi:hypothetical protein
MTAASLASTTASADGEEGDGEEGDDGEEGGCICTSGGRSD